MLARPLPSLHPACLAAGGRGLSGAKKGGFFLHPVPQGFPLRGRRSWDAGVVMEAGVPCSRLHIRDALGEELGPATSRCWNPALLGGKQGRGRDASVTFKNICVCIYTHIYRLAMGSADPLLEHRLAVGQGWCMHHCRIKLSSRLCTGCCRWRNPGRADLAPRRAASEAAAAFGERLGLFRSLDGWLQVPGA